MAWYPRSGSVKGLTSNFGNLAFGNENKSQREASAVHKQALAAQDFADLKKAQEFLKTLDQETTALLQQDCCTLKETAQFWKYNASEPCTHICEIADNPPHRWGGWWRASYLKLYVRSLLEVIKRIENKEDQLLLVSSELDNPTAKERVLDMLKNELAIAIQTFHSALESDALVQAHINVSQKLDAYKHTKTQFYPQHLLQVERNLEDAQMDFQIKNDEYLGSVGKYNAVCDRYNKLSDQYDTLSQQLQDYPRLQYSASFSRHWQNTLGNFNEGGKEKLEKHQNTLYGLVGRLETASLSANTQLHRLEQEHKKLKEQEQNLIKMEKDCEISVNYFKELQITCLDNLLTRIKSLKPFEHYCHAAGFVKHAIYIDFQDVDTGIAVKIGNLGPAGNPHRHHKPAQAEGSLPYVLIFDKTVEGQKQLKEFCAAVIKSITLPEEQAVKLLYDQNLGRKLTATQYEECAQQGYLTAELPQTIANCTAKGFLHLLRERLREYRRSEFSNSTEQTHNTLDFYYRRLMLSLFAWSKNAFYLRKSLAENLQVLPSNIHELLPEQTIQFMQKSEAVVAPHAKEEIWKLLTAQIAGLSFLPKSLSTPQPLVPSYDHARTASTYSLRDSVVNRPQLSEDVLARRLWKG